MPNGMSTTLISFQLVRFATDVEMELEGFAQE